MVELFDTLLWVELNQPLASFRVLCVLPFGFDSSLENVIVATSLNLRGRLQVVKQAGDETRVSERDRSEVARQTNLIRIERKQKEMNGGLYQVRESELVAE